MNGLRIGNLIIIAGVLVLSVFLANQSNINPAYLILSKALVIVCVSAFLFLARKRGTIIFLLGIEFCFPGRSFFIFGSIQQVTSSLDQD